MKKNIIGLIVVVIIIIVGIYFFTRGNSNTDLTQNNQTASSTDINNSNNPATSTPTNGEGNVIGKSVGGREIKAYTYGSGDKELLLVGGLHGGYEWNTSLLAYQLMDYFKNNQDVIPQNVKVTVIPVVNPDGLNSVVGTTTGNFSASNVSPSSSIVTAGRFNGNNVDLNRNFDCDWQATGKWQNKDVSGGTSAFSEPESLAIKNYVETNKPAAVVVYYSSAGGVYSSSCHNGVLPETANMTAVYAQGSGYPAYKTFDFYAITGDMVNWLAKNNIPAISVLLRNHTDTELQANENGLKALLPTI